MNRGTTRQVTERVTDRRRHALVQHYREPEYALAGARLRNPSYESEYRHHTNERDGSLAKAGIGVSCAVLIAFGISDYHFSGFTQPFVMLASLRTAVVLFGVVTAYTIGKASPARYDAWITAWLAVAVTTALIVNGMRPADYMMHFAFDHIILLSVYVVFVTTFWRQIAIGAFFTAGLIALAVTKDATFAAKASVIGSLICINLVGSLLAWRLHHLGRNEFTALLVQQKMRDKLEEMAFTDSLTGLSNRRDFIVQANAELARSRKNAHQFALIILDLDHFKQVNDRFGHEVGDAVLKAFASMLQDGARTEDVVARLGGEEFAIMLPDTRESEARDIAERFLAQTRNLEVEQVPAGSITVSAGFTAVHDADTSLSDLMTRADRALYEAKTSGRDRAVPALAKRPAHAVG